MGLRTTVRDLALETHLAIAAWWDGLEQETRWKIISVTLVLLLIGITALMWG